MKERKIKKILSGVLVLCRVVCMAQVNVFAKSASTSGNCGANGDNVTWELSDDGTLTISGSGKMKDYSYRDN